MLNKERNGYVVVAAIVLTALAISIGLYLSTKNTQNNIKQSGDTVTVNIDDDAIIGNRGTAKVAIVEFSDYECPYCKLFKNGTMNSLVESYVNKEDVILVFRDLPLAFHNPAAEREATAAECAREQGGDSVFFDYHDKIFDNTPGGGKGIKNSKLIAFSEELSLDKDMFETCLKSGKYIKEVRKDASDAAKIGIKGTPGFVIGVLDENGNVTGEKISGNKPLIEFSSLIDKYLSGSNE